MPFKKQLELEHIRQQCEKAKLDLENSWLSMMREGVFPVEDPVSSEQRFDINNLRLVPHFNEWDPDSFFVLFERISQARGWSDVDCALLLQCVLMGSLQEAFSSMSARIAIAILK